MLRQSKTSLFAAVIFILWWHQASMFTTLKGNDSKERYQNEKCPNLRWSKRIKKTVNSLKDRD